MEISNKILSNITVYMKYAKYIPELNRRESWYELVTRNMNMHIKKYPKLEDQIKEYEYIWKSGIPIPKLQSIADIPTSLIKARLSLGLTVSYIRSAPQSFYEQPMLFPQLWHR